MTAEEFDQNMYIGMLFVGMAFCLFIIIHVTFFAFPKHPTAIKPPDKNYIILTSSFVVLTKEQLEARETYREKTNRIEQNYTHHDWILTAGMHIIKSRKGITYHPADKNWIGFIPSGTKEHDIIWTNAKQQIKKV